MSSDLTVILFDLGRKYLNIDWTHNGKARMSFLWKVIKTSIFDSSSWISFLNLSPENVSPVHNSQVSMNEVHMGCNELSLSKFKKDFLMRAFIHKTIQAPIIHLESFFPLV